MSAAAEVAATLTGFIFVAISINLTRIVATPGLIPRAGEALGQLLGALIICMIALVPNDSPLVLGIIVLMVGLVLWIFQTTLQLRTALPSRIRPRSSFVFSQLATAPFILGGVSMMFRTLGGLYWIAAGVIVGMMVGVTNAWVLLIEILR